MGLTRRATGFPALGAVDRPQAPEPLPRVKSRRGFGSAGAVALLNREARERRLQPYDDNASCIIKSFPVSLRQHAGVAKSEDVRLELRDYVHSRSEIASVGSVRGSGDLVLERPSLCSVEDPAGQKCFNTVVLGSERRGLNLHTHRSS